MGDHDRASLVGLLAGLGRRNTNLTPQVLIDEYCQPGMESGWRSERREESHFHAGFIGWEREGHGYEDGDDYLGSMIEGGWCPLRGAGRWPFEIYIAWPAHESDPRYCIAHYCEGDFAVEVFDSKEAATNALAELPATPRAD